MKGKYCFFVSLVSCEIRLLSINFKVYYSWHHWKQNASKNESYLLKVVNLINYHLRTSNLTLCLYLQSLVMLRVLHIIKLIIFIFIKFHVVQCLIIENSSPYLMMVCGIPPTYWKIVENISIWNFGRGIQFLCGAKKSPRWSVIYFLTSNFVSLTIKNHKNCRNWKGIIAIIIPNFLFFNKLYTNFLYAPTTISYL